MSKRAVTSQRCIRCRINLPLCVCELIHPISVRTNISLVVHVSELTLSSNTAQFLKQMMPGQAEIFIRGQEHERFSPDPILERPGQQIFLFPSEDSLELNDEFLKNHPGPHHLIVPDGKWTRATWVDRHGPVAERPRLTNE